MIEGYKPFAASAAYAQLEIEATKAIASLVSDANGNEPDLTKHPWALHSIWRLAAPFGIAVILEWQPAKAGSQVPQVLVASGSPTAFATLRSSSAAEAGETASILYVVPYVD